MPEYIHLALHIIAIILIIAEIVLPSGGIISAITVLILGISWYHIFNSSDYILFWAIGDLICFPLAIYTGFKLMNYIGIINNNNLSFEEGFQVDLKLKKELIGQKANVVTQLRPIGTISFNSGEFKDQEFEASSNSEFIEVGDTVVVISVKENKIFVEKNITNITKGDQV